ncbi:hypothetical protein [Pseudomonas citronellolis]|uniref:hypothetical protein n=1 Tax=Pseudomonas citronellolis TaxID=53408 RepID=UPI000778921C|nr:hypothetical protein [Pseudomonas citronellolis]AMO78022.1 hypothetical protein PcP3B5_46300 [Pseudomonas citronellolis]
MNADPADFDIMASFESPVRPGLKRKVRIECGGDYAEVTMEVRETEHGLRISFTGHVLANAAGMKLVPDLDLWSSEVGQNVA